ncbi:hypothetical protein RIF25_13505 [Thermosynechococcaceae cyanobacterium BACA0444]|uniref:Uncharacterized protein n=1 Tax=Pseudocalidococcus azoricus BACA0444 TaxID=2918990 RepID=A0AAE4FVR3_9CYAN|nr:hypothetical protein [Pseudocalidococcus azoricus]MDS3861820.1 hypothetical protein [Pseudocalidococcus azoricus BACA0444]
MKIFNNFLLIVTARKREIVFAMIMPILFVAFSLLLRDYFMPYWSGNYSDPEYAYLLNSLNILKFKSPIHVDHPGTTLQLLGAIVIQVTFIIRSFLSNHYQSYTVVESVLKNPEFYLTVINNAILLASFLAIFLLGLVSFALTKNRIISLMLQINPFLWTILIESSRVRPESLLIPLTQAFVIVLLFYLYHKVENSTQFALSLGIILGLGIVTKVTFLPFMLSVFVLRKLRLQILVVLSTLVTFFLFTTPVITQYHRIFGWLISIATHTGRYGSGEKGFINFSDLPNTFKSLFEQDRLFFTVVFTAFIFSILMTVYKLFLQKHHYQWHEELNNLLNDKFYCILICLLGINFIQIAMTIKHPAIHYLLPSMGLCSLLIIIIGDLLYKELSNTLNSNLLHKISLFFFVAGLVVFVNSLYQNLLITQKIHMNYKDEIQAIHQLIDRNYKNIPHVRYYRCSDREYALKFGNDFAGSQFSNELQSIYPDGLFYNVWSKKYETFSAEVNIDDYKDKSKIIFHGTPFDTKYDSYEKYLPDFDLQKIYEGKYEALYLASSKPK